MLHAHHGWEALPAETVQAIEAIYAAQAGLTDTPEYFGYVVDGE